MSKEPIGYWEVDVGIKLRTGYDEAFTKQGEIDVIVGYLPHSSGAGFGYRDLQYPVSTPWRAKQLVADISEVLEEEDYVSSYYQFPWWLWKIRLWADERKLRWTKNTKR